MVTDETTTPGLGVNGKQAQGIPAPTMMGWVRAGYPVIALHHCTGDPTKPCSCHRSQEGQKCGLPGKHPRWHREDLPHGSKSATTDARTATRWFKRWPNTNVGIALAAGPVRLVDVAPDSPEALAEFKELGLDGALHFRSGGGEGHEHFIFRLPDDAPAVRICRSGEFDILSNGLFVAPPSGHKSGQRYQLLSTLVSVAKLPIAPDWVIERLREAEAKRQAVQRCFSETWAGCYNSDEPPVRLTGRALRLFQGQDTITKPDGAVDRSDTLYALAGELGKAGAAEVLATAVIAGRDVRLGFDKYSDRDDQQTRYTELVRRAFAANDRTGKTGRQRLFTHADARRFRYPSWDWAGIYREKSSPMVFSPTSNGKSTLVAGLMVAKAFGLSFLGREVRPGPCFYIAAEDFVGVRERVDAYLLHLGLRFEEALHPWHFWEGQVNFLEDAEVQDLIEVIRGLPKRPDTIFLDNLGCCVGSGDMVDQPTLTAYWNTVDRMKEELGHPTFLTMHHSAVGSVRPYGSSISDNRLDMAMRLELEERSSRVTVHCFKQRQGRKFDPFQLEFLTVDGAEQGVLIPAITGPMDAAVDWLRETDEFRALIGAAYVRGGEVRRVDLLTAAGLPTRSNNRQVRTALDQLVRRRLFDTRGDDRARFYSITNAGQQMYEVSEGQRERVVPVGSGRAEPTGTTERTGDVIDLSSLFGRH